MRHLRIALVVGLLFAGCATQPASVRPTRRPSVTPARRTEPAVRDLSGRSVTESCIERYSIENLRKRTFAFDGVVAAVRLGKQTSEDEAPTPDRVTFAVKRWYKGGSGPSAVRYAHSFGGYTSADGTPHGVGDRLLVAGDDNYIWTCGFTKTYDERTATEWAAALRS